MKITFIISTLKSGGAERVLTTLANEIGKEHQVTVVVFDRSGQFYSCAQYVEVRYLPAKFSSLFRKMSQAVNLWKELRRGQTDCFVSFMPRTSLISLLFKPRKIPIIISERNEEAALRSKFMRILRRLFYPKADILAVQFPEDAVYYRKWLPKVEVLRNPCCFEKQEKRVEKENLVIVVSRLEQEKNVSMFLRAVSMLEEDLRKSHRFCVLGEGSLKESLVQEAETLGVQVEFLGAVKNVEDFYGKAKIICLCSHVEGMPNVLIESLFFEVARISTKSSGGTLSLIEDGVDGFLVEKDDARAMSEKIALLVRNEDMRAQLVAQANKKRDLFDVKNIAKQWIDLIHKVRDDRKMS